MTAAPATATADQPTAEPSATAASSAATTTGSDWPVPMVEPDPDFQNALDSARFGRGRWLTNFSLHTVPYDEFLSGGVPRDGIPPLDDPKFESIVDADGWLEDVQPVVALEINGAARAYPLAILTWHEIANDTLGGVPVSVTFCPLCNSAVAFDRRVGEATLDFGVSGNLRHSDLVMWDRQTESWWQQLTGEGIVGAYAGYQLDLLPAQLVSWRDFKAAFPDADVLSRDTGHNRDYGRNPYSSYDRADQSPFLFKGRPDERLLPMERVAALLLDGQPLAFPFLLLEEERAVNYPADGRDIVVLFQPGHRLGPRPVSHRRLQGRWLHRRIRGRAGRADTDIPRRGRRLRRRADRLSLECPGASRRRAIGWKVPGAHSPRQPLLVRLGRLRPGDVGVRRAGSSDNRQNCNFSWWGWCLWIKAHTTGISTDISSPRTLRTPDSHSREPGSICRSGARACMGMTKSGR